MKTILLSASVPIQPDEDTRDLVEDLLEIVLDPTDLHPTESAVEIDGWYETVLEAEAVMARLVWAFPHANVYLDEWIEPSNSDTGVTLELSDLFRPVFEHLGTPADESFPQVTAGTN